MEDWVVVESTAEDMVADLGKMTVLVNHAVYLQPNAPVVKKDPGQWWKASALVI